MKYTFLLFTLLITAIAVMGQDNLARFHEYLQEGDTVRQAALLEQWESESPEDAELITCIFNYYFNRSRNEIITLNGGEPPQGEEVLVLKDSSDRIAGFIGSRINYDQSNLKLAFAHIDRGIQLYPDRLDMRFGKIYALGQIRDWDSFTREIIEAVDYSAQNDNQWMWTNNKPNEGGRDMFLSSLQDYQGQLYNSMDDKLLGNMQEIARAVLKHYPDHIESLSNLSVAYLVAGNYEQALIPLLKAEQIDPGDVVILFNIAYAYREDGKKEKAISYYQKVIEYGDEQAKSQAESEIMRLKE